MDSYKSLDTFHVTGRGVAHVLEAQRDMPIVFTEDQRVDVKRTFPDKIIIDGVVYEVTGFEHDLISRTIHKGVKFAASVVAVSKSLHDCLRAARDGQEPEKITEGIRREDFDGMIETFYKKDKEESGYFVVGAPTMLGLDDDKFKTFYKTPWIEYLGTDEDIKKVHLRAKQLGL